VVVPDHGVIISQEEETYLSSDNACSTNLLRLVPELEIMVAIEQVLARWSVCIP
jgi:hypothetical protein